MRVGDRSKSEICRTSLFPPSGARVVKNEGSMPAKIRTIRGSADRDGLIDFGKSIGPRGGTNGMITFQEGRRSTKIQLFQDKNEDGTFSKDELIFKGKASEGTYDELINTKRIKFSRQMHSCDWAIMKGAKPISCTLDFVPTIYELTLQTPNGKVVPEGTGRFRGNQIMFTNPLEPMPIA